MLNARFVVHILNKLCKPTCPNQVTSFRWVPAPNIIPVEEETHLSFMPRPIKSTQDRQEITFLCSN